MAEKKNKGGRPEVKFSPEDRKKIRYLAGLTLSQEEIAKTFGCDRDTLKKHCAEELELGKVEAKQLAVGKLFGNIKKGKEASIMFYLKTQHRWKETQVNENQQLPDLNPKVIEPDEK